MFLVTSPIVINMTTRIKLAVGLLLFRVWQIEYQIKLQEHITRTYSTVRSLENLYFWAFIWTKRRNFWREIIFQVNGLKMNLRKSLYLKRKLKKHWLASQINNNFILH